MVKLFIDLTMSNTTMVEAYKKMSKIEFSLIALSTGEKFGYLLEGNFVSKEIFETKINKLVDANKKTMNCSDRRDCKRDCT